MHSSLAVSLRRWTFPAVFLAVALPQLLTAAETDLLPAFGPEGHDFTTKAQSNHVVHGWLPTAWDDNTEWAPITATYSKLDDSPDPAATAVRINLEKMDDGQLQLTSYSGERTYEHGKSYRVSGWVRSVNQTAITIGARQGGDPYEMYFEQDFPTEGTWKPFAFDFAPTKDIKAIIMFEVKNVGVVDLAGVTVTDQGPASNPPTPPAPLPTTVAGKNLLPPIGADGDPFTTKAKNDHVVQGWLPKDWNDNTEWASVTATYSKLDENPSQTGVALRMKVEKLDDGQLQLTSYAGERIYDHGRIYRVSGWVRSPDELVLSVGARQSEDPYEMFYAKDIPTQPAWKQFEFEFAPKKDIKAIIMFAVQKVGTVDLANVTMTDEGPAE
jgi:hypothetical protein